MSGDPGPSSRISSLARLISDLDDASLMELSSQITPETRKRLLESLGAPPPSPVRKGKKPALKKPSPPKTLREQYILLRDLHYSHHVPWIQYLRGFLIVMSEEKGNISSCTDYKDPYKCWEEPADDSASTVMCLCPKRASTGREVRKPSTAKPKAAGMKTEGYVYYQIPSWLKDTCNDKGLQEPYSKMVLHKLVLLAVVLLAHLVLANVPADQVPTDKETSHLCGNPWCWLHLALEGASLNQARGPCFDRANETKFPCNAHGTEPSLYCIRSRAASALVPGLLVDGKDRREVVELSTARKWWNERDQPSGKNAVAFYNDVRKVGGKGRSGFQRAAQLISDGAAAIGSPIKKLLQKRSTGSL